MTRRYYTVFMPWLARALQKRGFELVDVQPNYKKPEYAVYKFEDSGALQRAVFQIMKERQS